MTTSGRTQEPGETDRGRLGQRSYLIESFYKVVSQKSIPAQIRQLVLYTSRNKGYVHGFVRELTFAKRPFKHLLDGWQEPGETDSGRLGMLG